MLFENSSIHFNDPNFIALLTNTILAILKLYQLQRQNFQSEGLQPIPVKNMSQNVPLKPVVSTNFQGKNYSNKKKNTKKHLPTPTFLNLLVILWHNTLLNPEGGFPFPVVIHPRNQRSSGFFSSTDGAEAKSAGLLENGEAPASGMVPYMTEKQP